MGRVIYIFVFVFVFVFAVAAASDYVLTREYTNAQCTGEPSKVEAFRTGRLFYSSRFMCDSALFQATVCTSATSCKKYSTAACIPSTAPFVSGTHYRYACADALPLDLGVGSDTPAARLAFFDWRSERDCSGDVIARQITGGSGSAGDAACMRNGLGHAEPDFMTPTEIDCAARTYSGYSCPGSGCGCAAARVSGLAFPSSAREGRCVSGGPPPEPTGFLTLGGSGFAMPGGVADYYTVVFGCGAPPAAATSYGDTSAGKQIGNRATQFARVEFYSNGDCDGAPDRINTVGPRAALTDLAIGAAVPPLPGGGCVAVACTRVVNVGGGGDYVTVACSDAGWVATPGYVSFTKDAGLSAGDCDPAQSVVVEMPDGVCQSATGIFSPADCVDGFACIAAASTEITCSARRFQYSFIGCGVDATATATVPFDSLNACQYIPSGNYYARLGCPGTTEPGRSVAVSIKAAAWVIGAALALALCALKPH